MTPIGQPYHASGPINFRSIASTLILGTFTAILAALAVWGWEISPIPTFVIFTSLGQAMVIGWVLSFSIGRLRMRNPVLLLIVGFACGLASAGLVHLIHHLRFVDEMAAQYRAQVEADPTLTPEQKREVYATIDKDPQLIADEILGQKTGHKGLVGSLLLRNEIGVAIKGAPVTGIALWLLWGAETLIVAGMAALIARNRASEPFCEDCGDWCHKQTAPLVLPGEAAGPLVDAIRSDDAAKLVALRDHPQESAGTAFCGTILYCCGGCDQTYADVWLRVDKVKKGKTTESTTKTLAQHISISPRMTALLCNQAEQPVEEVADEEGIKGGEVEPANEG